MAIQVIGIKIIQATLISLYYNSKYDAVVWRKCVRVGWEHIAMDFPIKKRINTEQFIGRTADLDIGETRFRVVTNKVIKQ